MQYFPLHFNTTTLPWGKN